ncbi:MAG: hypothetical protein FWH19_05105 [Treponema sp.]|nr:hypothetical protein [Treponema sp.]
MTRAITEQPALELLSSESVPMSLVRILSRPYLRTTALLCLASIFRNFFFLQWRSAFLPGRIPVSRADHPLDSRIPFWPCKVDTYIDFVALWVRSLGFLLRKFGNRAQEPVRNFLEEMGGLYAHAADVYRQNLSTTKRPFYIGRPRFLLIHLVDPHLMCVPSLHVLVVTRSYTGFAEMLKSLGEEGRFASQIEELRRDALAITEAVLYIKQHSVNCIPAALYAMSAIDPEHFPPAEAESFISGIFCDAKEPQEGDAAEIRGQILSLYRRFLAESKTGGDWKEPLFNFLKELDKGG